MTPSEKIIAEALACGDHATGIRRITINAAVMLRVFCECGNTLDQATASVIESDSGRSLAVACPKCIEKYRERVAARPDLKILTWDE